MRNEPGFSGRIGAAALAFAVFWALLAEFSSASPLVPQFSEIEAETRHNRAIEHLRKNEFDHAIEFEKKILSENPKDLNSYLILSIAYLGKDNEKKALEQAEAAKKIDSGFASGIYASMGRFYITKRRYHKGLVYLQESLKIKEDPGVIKSVAAVYLSQGLLEKARAYFEKLLPTRPDFVNLSRVYLAESRYEDAIIYAQKAIREDAKSSGGYLVLGAACILTDRPELAKTNFRVLKELNPEFFFTDYFIAIIDLMQKNYDEAVSNLKSTLASSPKFKEAYLNTAVAWQLKGELGKAREAALKAIELDPLDPASRLVLGTIDLSDGDYAGADAEFQKAGELFPEFNGKGFSSEKYFKGSGPETPAQFSLSVLYTRAGIYGQAIKAADSLLKPGQAENPFFTITRARAEARAGNGEKAEALYSGLIKSNPELISPYTELGDIHEAKKEFKKAVGLYKKAQASASLPIRSRLRLAELYARAGDTENAIEEYKKIISASPESAAGYKGLALALSESGKKNDEALKYAMKGASVNPEDAEMKDTLGWIYYKMGRHKDALDAYSDIDDGATADPVIFYHMGMVYRKLNIIDSAIDAFERALNINVEFSKADETKRLLKKLSGLG